MRFNRGRDVGNRAFTMGRFYFFGSIFTSFFSTSSYLFIHLSYHFSLNSNYYRRLIFLARKILITLVLRNSIHGKIFHPKFGTHFYYILKKKKNDDNKLHNFSRKDMILLKRKKNLLMFIFKCLFCIHTGVKFLNRG